MDDSEPTLIGRVVRVLERESSHQVVHLLIQGAGVEGQRDVPVGMLRVPVGGLQGQDNRLSRSSEAPNPLWPLWTLDSSGLLPSIEVRDPTLDLFEDGTPRIVPRDRVALLGWLDGRDSLQRCLQVSLEFTQSRTASIEP